MSILSMALASFIILTVAHMPALTGSGAMQADFALIRNMNFLDTCTNQVSEHETPTTN